MKAHTPWFIVCIAFIGTAVCLWACDQDFIAFITALGGAIFGANGLDEYERNI
jgi:hypothetical protein